MDTSAEITASTSNSQALQEAFSSLSFEEALISKLIVVLIILAVAALVSRLLQIPIRRYLGGKDGSKVGGTIFINLVRIFVWGPAICGILDICFGIDTAGAIGALGVVGIAVSLGAQQTIANLIGGVIVSLSRMIGPGDWITVKGNKEARVIDTNWRRTTLEDEDGIRYAAPNSVLVGEIVAKGLEYYTIVVPFSLKVTTPNVEGLLVECEQVLLDRMIEKEMDCNRKRPKAHIRGASLGAIQAEVKLYPNRTYDTRHVERAVLPALIDLLQERDALADVAFAPKV